MQLERTTRAIEKSKRRLINIPLISRRSPLSKGDAHAARRVSRAHLHSAPSRRRVPRFKSKAGAAFAFYFRLYTNLSPLLLLPTVKVINSSERKLKVPLGASIDMQI